MHPSVKILAYLASLTGLSLLLLWFFNPQLKRWIASRPWGPMPPISEPWIPHELSSALPDINSQYRGGEEKTGLFSMPLPRLDQPPILANAGVNSGTHTASKASAIPYGDGWIIAGDLGLVRRVDSELKPVWTFRTLRSIQGVHGTPASDGRSVYFGDYNGNLISLDGETGRVRWILPLGNSIGSSPLLTEDGFLYISVETDHPDGFLAKVNTQNGQLIWRSAWLGQHSHSSPSLDRTNNQVIVGDNTGTVSAFDLLTGKRNWIYQTAGPVKATPAISGAMIYISSWDGFLHILHAKNGTRLRRVWLSDTPNQSSAALWPEKDRGFVVTAKGLCRFKLSADEPLECLRETSGERATRRSSPSLVRSPTGLTQLWASCREREVCVIDPLNMRVLKKFTLSSAQTGEISFGPAGALALTFEEGTAVLWRTDSFLRKEP